MLAALNEGSVERQEYPRRLVIPNGTKDSFVNVDDIEWIEAADYYSCLHVGAKNLMLRETIKELAHTLTPQKFVRVHRSAIVNLQYVRVILRDSLDGESLVLMQDGQMVPVSRGYRARIAQLLAR